MFSKANAKFEPCSEKRNFCRSIWTVCKTRTVSLLPGIMKVKKTVRARGNIPKQRKIIRNWYQNAYVKRPYRHNTPKSAKSLSAFGQFVLTVFGHLSFIILHLCTKKEETLTKMCSDILLENKKVAGRLTSDLLTQSSTCSSIFSSNIGIWSKKFLRCKHS